MFRLGNKEYDLSNGGLFLVRTQKTTVEVTQLSVDLTEVSASLDACRAFGKEHPDLKAFIEGTSR